MSLTVVILTKDEELHIERAIRSVWGIATRIFVADSGSTDRTVEIATGLGAEVRFNPWRNYATQFNWALGQLPADTEWVLRLDADEYVTDALNKEIGTRLPGFGPEVAGVNVGRRMMFLGRPIRHGGLFPIRVLRLFRHGRGHCENRWMDEHITVTGEVANLTGEIIDDNHNSLTWWTAKHNSYASREVIDLLNLETRFFEQETVAQLRGGGEAGAKRWLKEKVYARLPGGGRAFAYFLYRYFVRLGFLDGAEGLAFHFLQGFWYRFLVDAKLLEVRRYMARTGADANGAVREVLGIELRPAA
jgi:glycosyltransferase involved in cell wall biosynthesis